MLRKKMLATTVLAVLPTVLMYIIIGSVARAEEDIYHAGSKDPCDNSVEYQAPADLNADATIEGDNKRGEDVHMGLNLPATDYTSGNDTADLRHSDIYLGDVAVSPDGTTSLNGKPLSSPRANANGCK